MGNNRKEVFKLALESINKLSIEELDWLIYLSKFGNTHELKEIRYNKRAESSDKTYNNTDWEDFIRNTENCRKGCDAGECGCGSGCCI